MDRVKGPCDWSAWTVRMKTSFFSKSKMTDFRYLSLEMTHLCGQFCFWERKKKNNLTLFSYKKCESIQAYSSYIGFWWLLFMVVLQYLRVSYFKLNCFSPGSLIPRFCHTWQVLGSCSKYFLLQIFSHLHQFESHSSIWA